MITDIAPGFGNKGIQTARRLFVERAKVIAVEAVGHGDKIKVLEDGDGAPFLCVQFDRHTTLTMRFWGHHRIEGWEPWFLLDTTRYFDWTVAADRQSRPPNWNSEAEIIIKAVQKLAATLTFVETP
jgi:hypothetical protein